MELYLETATATGDLRSSEFTSISFGQPKQEALSGAMYSSGEEKHFYQEDRPRVFLVGRRRRKDVA